ncbi:LCP family protein [Pseudonocardia eucalypti]|uniref:LCP family protein n=2 Tax=Pseudonocardia eucalypti TaxID=648755 RepID=A0ABP9PQP8_9PSEU
MDPRPHSTASASRRIGLRVVVALLSTMVLATTGIGWRFYTDLTGGINTSDVISLDGGESKPSGTDVNVLLVGVDSRTDAQGRPLSKQVLAQLRSGAEDGVLNSDTIILLHVPADGGKATAISVPRDSYVDIPGHGKGKINSAYPMATLKEAGKLRNEGLSELEVEKKSRDAGRALLVKTVEKLTDQHIDHFAEVNLLGFFQLTNAIGGVPVCLKNPVNEWRSGAKFPAGPQTISGGAALAFVRQRYELPQSDFSRIRRQQVFLASVAHKILSAGTLTSPSKLQGLIDTAKESVVLDPRLNILDFARQASNLAGGNLEFVTIPTAGADNNSSGDVVVVDTDDVQKFVKEKIQATGTAAPPPAAKPDPSQVTVDVRNGTGRSGLAAQVARKLDDHGYQQGKLDNIDDPPKASTVHYAPGHSEQAKALADVLGGINTEEDSALTGDTTRVYLASDFSVTDITSPSEDDRSSSSSRHRSSAPAAPPAPPITADGVPCID